MWSITCEQHYNVCWMHTWVQVCNCSKHEIAAETMCTNILLHTWKTCTQISIFQALCSIMNCDRTNRCNLLYQIENEIKKLKIYFKKWKRELKYAWYDIWVWYSFHLKKYLVKYIPWKLENATYRKIYTYQGYE